jgi:hypothetical protein
LRDAAQTPAAAARKRIVGAVHAPTGASCRGPKSRLSIPAAARKKKKRKSVRKPETGLAEK